MNKHGAALVMLCAFALPATLAAQEGVESESSAYERIAVESAPPDPSPGEPETVLVTGEHPGPGLVKVSRDGHVLWVLGSIGSVPETIAWRTDEVEAAIAQSQEAQRLAATGAEVQRGVDIIKQVSDLAVQAQAQIESDWLAAAEEALSRNESTFAVLSVRNALSDTGYLAKLRERGYQVEAPR